LAINTRLKIDPEIMNAYLGRYQGGSDFFAPGATITVEKQDGHLVLRWSMGGISWLAPVTELKFYDRMFGAGVAFIKDDKGRISHLIYRFSGVDYRANKAQIE
jgi:hypothetical protein